jgi:hypothetical protein
MIARARSDWVDWPDTSTPIRAQDLDLWDRAVYDLRSSVFNVKDQEFGAVGDGSTDDTAAIQAAIDAAEAATYRGLVFLPPGNYAITSPLTIRAHNITLAGAGRSSVGTGAARSSVILAKSSFSGSYLVDVAGTTSSDYLESVSIRDLTIDGFGAGSPFIDASGLYWRCTQGQIANVTVQRVRQNGIVLEGVNAGGGAHYNFLTNVAVVRPGADGIKFLTGGVDNTVLGSFVYDSGGNSVTNTAAGNQFIGSYFELADGYHIHSTVAQQLRIIGCRLRESSGGIYIASAGTDGPFQISACSIKNASEGTANTTDGINIAPSATARGGIISGVVFTTTNANPMRYGVNIANSNAQRVVVSGISEGYQLTATSTFGTGAINDQGTNTIVSGGLDSNLRSFDKLGNGVMRLTGTGTPEGAVTAPVGSTYHRSDGGAGTSFYVKESGSSNTGWVAK